MPDLSLMTFEQVYVFMPASQVNEEKRRAAESANDEANQLRAEMTALSSTTDTIRSLLSLGNGDDLVIAVQALVTENGNLKRERATQDNEIVQLQKSITTLTAQIAELTKPQPPEIEPPDMPDTQPIITPTDPVAVKPTEKLSGLGFTITLGLVAPSLEVDTAAGELMRMGAKMGFEWTRFFRNKEELSNDIWRKPDDPRNLYALALQLGLKVAADTIDVIALRLTDSELDKYLDYIETMGAKLLVFNDANQYREAKNADGSPKYPPGTLERLVERVRKRSKLPLMASLTATAALGAYTMFDYTEAQCFGRIGELDDFLKRPFDAFCLEGRASASLDYLMKAHDILLQFKPSFAWWYTAFDKQTDWRTMPDKVALIEKTVKALKAQRPQPVL